jgi:hypothetical protein
MNFEHDPGRSALHRAWTAVRLKRYDDALKLYQEAIGIARANSIELRTGLLGAAIMHTHLGDDELAEVHMDGYLATAPPAPHPKYQQLYIPIEDLVRLPYLRKHEIWASTPGKFNPKKRIKGNQGLIAATVWRRDPWAKAWVATTYWLKSYDPPYDYTVYHGGDSCPCEARTPMEVLAATGCTEIPKFLEALP